jgi:drug/metabolite transporter (DMT)-like permease
VAAAPLLMLLLAACLHAAWNYRLKQCQDRLPVLWWALAFSSVAVLPSLCWVSLPSGSAWWLVLASAAAQALYLGLLSRAYALADFSLVYPIARGSAPLFLMLWSSLFLHEALSTQGLTGVAVLSLGLMALGASGRRGASHGHLMPALAAALGVAMTISVYTAIDGLAVKTTPPLSYFVAQWSLSVVLALPALLWVYSPQRLLGVLVRERAAVGWVGLGSGLAYLLALQAYSMAPVAYAGAVRESSVVVAAWLGWRAAGEPSGQARLAASLVIFAGLGLIALAR